LRIADMTAYLARVKTTELRFVLRRGVRPCAALFAIALASPALAAAVTVKQFSPEGTVKQVQQVTARFSAAMVPFGDLTDVAPPFAANCAMKATSRWIDTTTWSYDFEKPLPGGLRCTFTMRPDLHAGDGSAVTGPRSFTFSTGGPAVVSTYPSNGDTTIDEQQIFLLGLDAEVDYQSARGKVAFVVDGLPERIEADRVEGATLEAILAAMSRWSRPTPPLLALKARRSFPNGVRVRLEWGKGIRAVGGEQSDKVQTFQYTTRPAFTVDTACRRENARAGCVPITPVTVQFSSQVSAGSARALRLLAPDGKSLAPEPPDDDAQFTSSVTFRGPFHEDATYTVKLPADLRDDAGRALPAGQDFALPVKMGPMPVLAKFASRFGIVERNAEPALPVTLRSIEADVAGMRALPVTPADAGLIGRLVAGITGTDLRVAGDDPKKILDWLRRVSASSRRHSILEASPTPKPGTEGAATGAAPEGDNQATTFRLPKPAPAKEMEVVGIPVAEPGLHVVEIASPLLGAALLGQDRKMYAATAVLVTNLSVHFKRGRESSIAWVTTLDTAAPVAGARVSVSDCHGAELASAETGADGVARFATITDDDQLPNCWQALPAEEDDADGNAWRDRETTPALSGIDSGILVVARTSDDMSFVHSSWDSGIESWRFHVYSPWEAGKGSTLSTILDRPLFRSGETVHMKHVLRARTLEGFVVPPAEQRPVKAAIVHSQSDQRYPIDVRFDDAGIASGDWVIPAGARLGAYSIEFGDGYPSVTSGSFRVEQFRIPLLRGEVIAPPLVPARATSLNVDVSVRYLAGGAASELPVLLRSELRPTGFEAPEDYDGYTFAAGAIKDGFDDAAADDGDEEGSSDEAGAKPHARQQVQLDAAGTARIVVADLPAVSRPTSLVLEAEFRDPNGETETVATTRMLLPASVIPGIQVDDWVKTGGLLHPRVVVVTPDGKPAAGVAVRIEAARQEWYSNRKRLVGGFYDYGHSSETKRIGLLCEGRSDARGLFTCEAKAPARGQVVVEATVTDEAGNKAATHTNAYIGDEDYGFDTGAGDRIDLLPEKRAYEPGETARLQVRMPFREATALVTVEREGVGATSVVHLVGENPVVEVPITGEHAPNVFVSVLAVRGRVGDVQPTALVDLGRPAFKLGLTELRVDWKSHRLDVAVTSDREVFRTRENAKIHVRVRRADGSAPPAGSEVAISAVDEGLLELMPNTSWNLLDAMMSRRGHEVNTCTAQGQVIGKRHYGKKALLTGGGGMNGAGSTRELFDTLLFWSARVKLDDGGEANVEVPLNDSLTSFRVAAVATAAAGEFGTGSAVIRSTRELSVLSGLPLLVREGDQFGAEFTVRNTGDKPLEVSASGTAGEITLAEQKLTLAAGEARVLTWPIEVPKGSGQLAYTMTVRAAAGLEDKLLVRQRVIPANNVRVVQATLEQLDGTLVMPVRAPDGADPKAAGSGITVSAAPSLAASVDSMKEWLANYPYRCLEQRVSMAVGREDDALWRGITDDLATYQDGDGLLRYFPGNEAGDDRLTAYVLTIATAAGRTLPEDAATRMKDGLKGFVAGTIVRNTGFALPDLTLRKLAAIEALARAGAADPSMLSGIVVQPELWPTSAVLDWWSILVHTSGVVGGDDKKKVAERVLRARMDLSGTTLVFTTAAQDQLWWMMATSDSNAVRLLLHLADNGLWKEDAPRLLRGVVARREHGAWDTTVANAWGVLAMRRFAKAFESQPVTGITTMALADARRSIDWSVAAREPVTLAWPESASDLVVKQEGSGKPWITTTARAATPISGPVAAGYRVTKTVTPIEPKSPDHWSRGDRMLVRLDIEAQRPMWWVVIDDPVPAGASHLGTGLGRGAPPPGVSWSDWLKRFEDGQLSPSYVERSHQSWRGYVRVMPQGHSRIEYSIRVNQAGTFRLPPTRVEALYAPEVFGEMPNGVVRVEP